MSARRVRERLEIALHFQSPRAADLALEAWFAYQRGEFERCDLLVEAAVCAHWPYVGFGELADEEPCDSAAEFLRRVRGRAA